MKYLLFARKRRATKATLTALPDTPGPKLHSWTQVSTLVCVLSCLCLESHLELSGWRMSPVFSASVRLASLPPTRAVVVLGAKAWIIQVLHPPEGRLEEQGTHRDTRTLWPPFICKGQEYSLPKDRVRWSKNSRGVGHTILLQRSEWLWHF